ATANNLIRKVNEANPPLTISYSGFVLGENESALLSLPNISTTATITTPLGAYPITLSGGDALNYVIELINGVLTITDKNIPVIIWNDPEPITYGVALTNKQLNASVTYAGLPITGTLTYDPPLGTVLEAGNGQLLSVGFVPGAPAIFATIGDQVQIGVNRAPLTITAQDKTMFWSRPMPQLTATYSGFVNGDGPQDLHTPVTLGTTAKSTSAIGVYKITASGASDPNYNISFVDGKLAIRLSVYLPFIMR
ncbi:MAG TPA: MBG domain-containing protein, partial [Roseiflexaceae bacterium]|nr:MBG domain-containing protein [Roseiflexaceae bacterium]